MDPVNVHKSNGSDRSRSSEQLKREAIIVVVPSTSFEAGSESRVHNTSVRFVLAEDFKNFR